MLLGYIMPELYCLHIHAGGHADKPPRGGRWVTHLHIKLVSGLESIYAPGIGNDNTKRGTDVRDKNVCIRVRWSWVAKVSANPWPLAVRHLEPDVCSVGVVVECSDGMPAILRRNLFWAFDLGLGGLVIDQGGPGSVSRKGTACLLPRFIAPDC